MGNLGRYQEIVELAKRSGGVDAMIEMIKKGAVEDAAPKLVAGGLAAGAVIGAGAVKGYGWVKGKLTDRRVAVKNGENAERHLRAVVEHTETEPMGDATPGIAPDEEFCEEGEGDADRT